MKKLLLISIVIAAGCNQCCGDESSVRDEAAKTPSAAGVIYRNPRVYNVDYSFELVPDSNKIDRAKDLKLWIPIPREWDSQKAVKIVSVEPEPHAKYVDPEYGNPMLFWDFGKEPEQPSYKVDIKFRLESYEIHAEVDPERVGRYDKTSKEYALYTRSTHTVSITPKIKELAQIAVGDEKNPYLQAERIFKFVRQKMRYKILDFERGRGIKCLLDFPVIDKETGEEYYEGACNQYSAFFIALCRAVGIPARSVQGNVGWRPWAKEEELKPRYEFETKLSPLGLAGAQHYGALNLHTWAECHIPNYGWIPVDAQKGRFGHLRNEKVVLCKGRDVKLGPDSPQAESQGYGSHWVSLYQGRADSFHRAAWNIAKIRTAKIKTLHVSDPFPSDALAGYAHNLYPEDEAENNLRGYRNRVLRGIDKRTRGVSEKGAALAQAYEKESSLRYQQEPFICHMLREVVGKKKSLDIFDAYVNLRVSSGEAVATERFQRIAEDIYGKPLGWFWEQWLDNDELPQLKLDGVTFSKDQKEWYIRGNLRQLGDSLFRLPVELVLTTEKDMEHKKVWLRKVRSFEFNTSGKPKSILVDPDNDILKIQKMGPLLNSFWYVYPNFMLSYGTTKEGEANKAAAERFNKEFLRLGRKIVKADVDVNKADLKTKCVMLFGRPETNKITQKFKDSFPIKFDGSKFTWQGTTYDEPTQGVAQIVENPDNPGGLIILYAGLSPEATRGFCDLSSCYSAMASYVIFDGDKELLRGDWKVDSNLYWNFDTHSSVLSAPNEQ